MAHSARARPLRVGEGVHEGSGHADAVLVLGKPVVGPGGGEGPAGQQVVLVGGIDQPTAQGLLVDALPLGDGVEDAGRLRGRVGAHLGLIGELADAQRHDADGGQGRVLVENAGHGVLERHGRR